MKKWQILNQQKMENGKTRKSGFLRNRKIENIIKLLLQNRGLKSKKQIDEFLTPPEPNTLNPSDLGINAGQLQKAVNRIKQAMSEKESIVVYGDYDADGVCGTAVLWEGLNKLGAKVMPYIPHRVEEGYGFSQKGIDFIKKEYKTDLIVTVDHGIGSVEKVDYCRKLGIEVIITDHHVAPEKLPAALAIVQTTDLCGAGIAWVLSQALKAKTNYLDLVVIATIADMVPLTGTNRILVKYGLEELHKTTRLGLEALIKETGLTKEKISVYDVSHILAPRLNAMGRMEHAMDSLRLLCTRNKERAQELARHLDRTNRSRQQLTEQTLQHARSAIKDSQSQGNNLLFIAHRSYEQGVIGLVAGKLVEEFYRPAIVVSWGEEFCKASARSINGFNIIETIRKAQDLLVDAGGHPMAAGFTVETKNLEVLKQRLIEIADQELNEEKLTRVLKIDCLLDLEDITFDLYEALAQFKPYGLGNPEPVFASSGVIVKEARVIGADGKHLRLLITHNSSPITIHAVAFGMGELLPRLSPDHPVDIAYTLAVDEWNGNKRLELKIKDIKIRD